MHRPVRPSRQLLAAILLIASAGAAKAQIDTLLQPRGVPLSGLPLPGDPPTQAQDPIANGIQALLHVLFYVPLVYLTALVITALFGMTALIRIVAERHYPELKRENGGSFVGSLWNALIAMIVFIVLWVVTLPLWLIGVGVLVPFAAAAYLNQRLFRYDAIAEHASAAEMAALFKNARGGWWGLGVLTGLVQFVPLLNLLGPVFAALAFIHYGLARLTQQRQS